MAQGSLLTNIFSKVVTGVLDEMVDAVESVGKDSGARTATVSTSSSRAAQRLPLTDEKGRCMGCGNRCHPVRPNCKKRQRALAKWRPS